MAANLPELYKNNVGPVGDRKEHKRRCFVHSPNATQWGFTKITRHLSHACTTVVSVHEWKSFLQTGSWNLWLEKRNHLFWKYIVDNHRTRLNFGRHQKSLHRLTKSIFSGIFKSFFNMWSQPSRSKTLLYVLRCIRGLAAFKKKKEKEQEDTRNFQLRCLQLRATSFEKRNRTHSTNISAQQGLQG